MVGSAAAIGYRAQPMAPSIRFPPGFTWGVATSAFQCEGAATSPHSSWTRWEELGNVRAGNRSGVACDWWANAERDFDIARDLGLKALRMSIEWSRIEPRPGRWDDGALERYGEMAAALRERGIEPMITLHHFTNPIWFEISGGFLREDSPDLFSAAPQSFAEGEYSAFVEAIGTPPAVHVAAGAPTTLNLDRGGAGVAGAERAPGGGTP